MDAWRGGIVLVKCVYEATKRFPPEERYGLTSQMRRAAVSIPSNIAEGAARGSQKEFLQFPIVARGSMSELETLLTIASEVDLLAKDLTEDLEKQCDRVSSCLSGLISTVRSAIQGN